MMKPKFYLILSILFLSLGFTSDTNDALVESIHRYFNERQLEKIFLHYNKKLLVPGDDFWYSAQVLNYYQSSPTRLSEILHLELFDRDGNSVLHCKTRIQDGQASGYLRIPQELPADFYQIKAYTNWSRNFDQGMLYTDYVKVVSPTYEPTSSQEHYSVQFFPEGGTFLESKLNTIGFKTTYLTPSMVFITANNGQDTVSRFSYDGSGNGAFKLIPDGRSFSMAIEKLDEPFSLPESVEKGTVLRLSEEEQSFYLTLENSTHLDGVGANVVLLKNGSVVSLTPVKLSSKGIFLGIPKSTIPEGINHLLVIDEFGRLLNTRVFGSFMSDNANQQALKVSSSDQFAARTTSAFVIESNLSDTVRLSIAVAKAEIHSAYPKQTMEYRHLLADRGANQLNEFLITQPISGYDPNELTRISSPEYQYAIEKEGVLSIQLPQKNSSAEEAQLIIALKRDTEIDLFANQANTTNELSFLIPSFNGAKELIISPIDAKLDQQSQLINTIGNEPFTRPFTQSEWETAYALEISENQLIDRKYEITNRKEQFQPPVPPSFSILNDPDESIALKEYIYLPTMEEVFIELLKCARIKNDKIQLCGFDKEAGTFEPFMKKEPLRLIDGVRIDDSSDLLSLNTVDIKKINLYYGKYILNKIEFQGIMEVHTEEGNYGALENKGQIQLTVDGFSDAYRFIDPALSPDIPDFRSTVYWNSDVIIAGNASKEIAFSLPDEPGAYVMEIQGLSSTGKVIYYEHPFEVIIE